MPDHIEPVNAADQVDWPAMLHDLEKRIELLSDSLEGVKLSMRRIVLAEPWLHDGPPSAPAEPQHAEVTWQPAPVESHQPAVMLQPDEPVVMPYKPAAVEYDEDAREVVRRAVLDAVEYDEEAREAVRRAVEEARTQTSADDLRDGATDYVTEEKPEVSWVTVPDDGSEPEPLPVIEDNVVEEDPEAAREAVRRAVEEAKAEMGVTTASNAPSATPVDDEEAAREAVRQAVVQARAEMASSSHGGHGGLFEASKPIEVAPKFVVPPPHRPERIHPPTITIEDPEGRVELAMVYNLLKHLNVAANSSLLNYSSRQVSVQLSDNHPPEAETVAEAARDVFERESDVRIDGLNVILKLGNNYIRAA